jgi:hypothetical protein
MYSDGVNWIGMMAPGKEPLLGSYEYSYETSRLFLDQVSEC